MALSVLCPVAEPEICESGGKIEVLKLISEGPEIKILR